MERFKKLHELHMVILECRLWCWWSREFQSMGRCGSEKTLLPAMTGKLSRIKAMQQAAERLHKTSEPKRQHDLCSESRSFTTRILRT